METYRFIAHDAEDVDRRIRRSLEVGGRQIGERDYRRRDLESRRSFLRLRNAVAHRAGTHPPKSAGRTRN